MNKICTFHYEGVKAKGDRIGAAFFMDADYEPVAVRIHAEHAPHVGDAEFEVLKDGVSIMNNRDSIQYDNYGRITSNTNTTTIVLPKGQTSDENAEDFIEQNMDYGSWLTCELSKDGGGNNFTIQLELEPINDDGEEPE